MEVKEEIREKKSVLFLCNKLQAMAKSTGCLEIKYEYREWSCSHIVELSSLERLTKSWINLMYEFNHKFMPERIVFVLKGDAPSLKIKEPLYTFQSGFSFAKVINFSVPSDLNVLIFKNLKIPVGVDKMNVETSRNRKKWFQFAGHETRVVSERNYNYSFS